MNYWPTDDMEVYLRLQNRVQARMALADLTASGDEDPFSEEDMEQDLRFRDAQLLQLREEIPDLDQLDDAPVLADFTLDDFLTQCAIWSATKLPWRPCPPALMPSPKRTARPNPA